MNMVFGEISEIPLVPDKDCDFEYFVIASFAQSTRRSSRSFNCASMRNTTRHIELLSSLHLEPQIARLIVLTLAVTDRPQKGATKAETRSPAGCYFRPFQPVQARINEFTEYQNHVTLI